jgi:hypothetical protein
MQENLQKWWVLAIAVVLKCPAHGVLGLAIGDAVLNSPFVGEVQSRVVTSASTRAIMERRLASKQEIIGPLYQVLLPLFGPRPAPMVVTPMTSFSISSFSAREFATELVMLVMSWLGC